jgi:hypothetical protein
MYGSCVDSVRAHRGDDVRAVALFPLRIVAADEGEQFGKDGIIFVEDRAAAAPRLEGSECLVDRKRAALDRLAREHDEELAADLPADARRRTVGREPREVGGDVRVTKPAPERAAAGGGDVVSTTRAARGCAGGRNAGGTVKRPSPSA